MKCIFTADIHYNKKRLPLILDFFKKLKEVSKDAEVIMFGGDLWDSTITNTKTSGFSLVMKELYDLSQTKKIIAISGTPKHEPTGSIDFINALGGTAVTEPQLMDVCGMSVLAIPELRRSDFISESSEKTTSLMNEKLDEICGNKCDLIIYHGEISGALYDNGEKASSEVQLTKSMIDRSGAQLVLAGHIHSPQKVFDRCHYAGSPVPVTFGESHSGSVISFEFNSGVISEVRRIDLGFPVNKILECDLAMYRKLFTLKFPNINLKIKLSLTAEERKLFHVNESSKSLKEATGANTVSIIVSTASSVSVRTREIRNKKTITDKLRVYAEVNNIQLTKSIIEKSMQMEDNLLIKYQFPSHSMELLSLSLRGAIGLTGREEIFIDFSKYEDGLLCILGDNGKGKSTILENCQPYPQMLTRSGSLKNHFYLKDSHRILVYRDENGKLYKFIILITAHIASGSSRYLVQTSDDNGNTWKPVQECDGNLDTYQTYVENTFGSLALFLRTSFFSKEQTKGIPDIASATKGQRIELISHLIGTDDISAMHDMTKEKLKEISGDIDRYTNVEQRKKELDELMEKKTIVRNDVAEELAETNGRLTETEKELAETKEKQADYNQNVAKYGSLIKLKESFLSRLAEIDDLLSRLTEHKKKNDFVINNRKFLENYVKEKKALAEQQKKVSDLMSEVNELSGKIGTEQDLYYEEYDDCSNESDKLTNILTKIEKLKESRTPEDLTVCPTCGAKLSERKKNQIMSERLMIDSELNSLEAFRTKQKDIVSERKKRLTEIKSKLSSLRKKQDAKEEEFRKENEILKSIQAYIDMNSEFDCYTDYVIVTNLEGDIEKYEAERNTINEKLNSLSGIDFVDLDSKIETMEAEIKTLQDERLRLSMSMSALNTEVAGIQKELDEINSSVEKVRELSKEYEEYSILEQAFSNGGIQALELEAAAPDIAEITNSILLDSCGDKFTVNFSTLHQGRTKMINDFSIDVTNTEKGITAPIEYLSTGEKIWIMQSLYYAFSIIRMEKTGFSFRIRFCDECDGSLDSEMKLKYIDMISAAHKAGNARLTVLITHSQEVKDSVTQVINL